MILAPILINDSDSEFSDDDFSDTDSEPENEIDQMVVLTLSLE